MRRSAGIAGLGFYVPERIMYNDELGDYCGIKGSWIEERLGIKMRRIASQDQALSDLAYYAASRAMDQAEVHAKQIDLIIVCAISHDKRAPATAAILQKRLGAINSAAFDVNVGGCPGSSYSLVIAQQFVENGMYDTVLVISGEIYSKIVDFSDRNVAPFFGDGVGAVILKSCRENKGIISSVLGADGEGGADKIVCEGGSRVSINLKNFESGKLTKIEMDNKAVWKFGTQIFPRVVELVSNKAGVDKENIDWIIPHQANINMIKKGIKTLGLSMDNVYTNMDRYANTGGGSVLIALAEAFEKGLIKSDEYVVLASFGAGFSWGALLMRWCSKDDFII